eukprot:scaffold5143_cov119-Isochrysis_galbana.AAC.16
MSKCIAFEEHSTSRMLSMRMLTFIEFVPGTGRLEIQEISSSVHVSVHGPESHVPRRILVLKVEGCELAGAATSRSAMASLPRIKDCEYGGAPLDWMLPRAADEHAAPSLLEPRCRKDPPAFGSRGGASWPWGFCTMGLPLAR